MKIIFGNFLFLKELNKILFILKKYTKAAKSYLYSNSPLRFYFYSRFSLIGCSDLKLNENINITDVTVTSYRIFSPTQTLFIYIY